MLRLNRTFVREWARVYDQHYQPRQRDVERRVKAWLRGQPGVKHLDKGHFVALATWKTPRSRPAYERNAPTLVRDATNLASRASNERLKVHVLTALEGVNVTLAATILHFMHPRSYPIFDFHARRTLKKTGWWKGRPASDASVEAWEQYIAVMRQLARRFRVSLRDLDKALYAYDRWR
jgi:hypothetical protein